MIAAPLGGGNDGIGRRSEDDPNLVASTITSTYGTKWNGNAGAWSGGNFAPATTTGVRRLTPTECERLQGFPDNWTQLGGTPDSRRYSALGDAVTVNVAEWIGGRIA